MNHWARIGLALETAKDVSHRRVIEVLAGSRPYDELNDEEQAIVRAEWAERVEATRAALDIADETTVYDNSSARTPLRPIARYRLGEPIGIITWPDWVPTDLRRRPAD